MWMLIRQTRFYRYFRGCVTREEKLMWNALNPEKDVPENLLKGQRANGSNRVESSMAKNAKKEKVPKAAMWRALLTAEGPWRSNIAVSIGMFGTVFNRIYYF